jgi:hypothetical protein
VTGAASVWRWLDSRAATRVIQVVAIVSLLLALFVGLRQYSLADCLSRYADDNAKASAQRLLAAEQDRKAWDDVISEVAAARSAPPGEGGKRVAEAFDRYLQQRAEADEQRRRNPPPAPPSERCH